jgi:hypothetical protein
MTELEIFTRVTANKKKIEELMDYTTFVLNREVVRLEDEITALQNICKHTFENGTCKHCGKEEK